MNRPQKHELPMLAQVDSIRLQTLRETLRHQLFQARLYTLPDRAIDAVADAMDEIDIILENDAAARNTALPVTKGEARSLNRPGQSD